MAGTTADAPAAHFEINERDWLLSTLRQAPVTRLARGEQRKVLTRQVR